MVNCPACEPVIVIVCPLVDTVGGPVGPLFAGVAVPGRVLALVEAAGLVVVLVQPLTTTAASSIVNIDIINNL